MTRKCQTIKSSTLVSFQLWSAYDQVPAIVKNFGPYVYNTIPVNFAALHPGQQNERAVARWTATCNTNISVSAQFFQGDMGNTDAAIGINTGISGTVIWTAADTSVDPLYTGDFAMSGGDSIDFILGFGPDTNFFSDTTPVAISITEMPGCLTASPTIDPADAQAQALQAHIVFLVIVIVPTTVGALILSCLILILCLRRRRRVQKAALEAEARRPKFYQGIMNNLRATRP
jgi:hypothetical protein